MKRGGLIEILVSAPQRRCIIRDNGSGMSEDKMRKLPIEIGESEKFERQDTRGEKGIGLFAFGSIGHSLHLISKRKHDPCFGYLHYMCDDKANEIKTEFDRITAKDVNKFFGESFEHGTIAVLDIERDVFARYFKDPAAINRILRQTYAPLLFGERINISTGRFGEGTKEVQAENLRGDNVLSNTIAFAARTKGEMKEYGVFVHLNVDPQDNSGVVPIFNHGVRVYDSIIEMDPDFANCELFTCRQVSGFIDEIGLGLTLGRDGIEKSSNAYRSFRETLLEIAIANWPRVKEMLETGKSKIHDRNAREAYDLIKEAFQSTDPLYKETRIRNESHNPPNVHPKPNPAGPKVVNPAITSEKKRIFPFRIPIFQSFGHGERNIRSKLDQIMGHPVVAINLDHPHYRQISEKSGRDEITYIVEVSLPVMAEFEIQKARENGIMIGGPGEVAAKVGQRILDLRYAAFNKNR